MNKPKMFFPAMNTQMLNHAFVQDNISKLSSLPNTFIHPTTEGILACGDEGEGKLASVEEIINLIETHHFVSKKKKVLITTGATIAPLDPVRFLTNPSSGLTGYFLAKKYLAEGYDVHVIATSNSTEKLELLKYHPRYRVTRVHTTEEMKKIVGEEFLKADIYISSAALCDIQFETSNEKIKKDTMNGQLSYKQAPDILQEVLSQKKQNQQIVGFAAETSQDSNIFIEKWKRKPVDLLIGNRVSNGVFSEAKGFNKSDNSYFFIKDGAIVSENFYSKTQLADQIFERIN